VPRAAEAHSAGSANMHAKRLAACRDNDDNDDFRISLSQNLPGLNLISTAKRLKQAVL
jgi:hypothetical protein